MIVTYKGLGHPSKPHQCQNLYSDWRAWSSVGFPDISRDISLGTNQSVFLISTPHYSHERFYWSAKFGTI